MKRAEPDRQALGERGERLAESHLAANGLTTLARNYRIRQGEVDLVMNDAGTLVFVEVRVRSHADFGGALASVNRTKQRRLARAAAHYLATRVDAAPPPCRFDVVAIDPGSAHVEWVTDAFEIETWT